MTVVNYWIMEQKLIEYGLSEKEAKMYLICLKTGEATANRLIGLTGFARGTAYDVLEKLKSKGLISSFVKGKATVFNANDPDVLVKALDEKRTGILKAVAELKALHKTISRKNIIEVYEGLGGVNKVLNDILTNSKEVIVMGNEYNARQIILHHPENFRVRRLELKIRIKNLLEGSQTARTLKNDRYSQVRHYAGLKNSKEVLIIYNDTTAHILMEEPTTTVKIISKEYTKTQRMLFENIWKDSKH